MFAGAANLFIFAQQATLSYGGAPHLHFWAVPVSLTPTSSNIASLAYSTSTYVVASGFPLAPGIAMDASSLATFMWPIRQATC